MDILAALDGLPALNVCLLNGGCHRSTYCAAHAVWVEAQAQMRETLGSATLERLARETRERRNALSAGKPRES